MTNDGSNRSRLALGLAVLGLPLAFVLGLSFDTLRQLAQANQRSETHRPSRGGWHPAPSARTAEGATEPAFAALPYLDGYRPPSGAEGVTVLVPERVQEGDNLVVSSHEAGAFLLSLEGERLHRWRLPPLDTWGEHRKPEGVGLEAFQGLTWRTARPLPDGGLVAIYEGLGLVRIDADSRVLWARWAQAHHSLQVLDDGRIWVLEREWRDTKRPVGPRRFLDDQLTLVDPEGRLLRRLSLTDAFEKSPWSPLLAAMPFHEDPFHTNSIRQLDTARLPSWGEGGVLVSIRGLNALVVVDPAREEVVWALAGRFERQHDAQLLSNGNLLVYDNRPSDDVSRIVEFDPQTLDVAWEFAEGFSSAQMGAVQRLENGNTLIVESFGGRAFEVTPDHKVVWEWVSPFRVGGEDGQPELVATLCDVHRVPRSFGERLRSAR